MPNKDVILYLDGSNPPPVVVVTEADTAWTFRFTVMYNGAIYAPNVNNVILAGHKPDGNAFAYAGSKSGSVYQVGCNVQMTAVPGDVLAALHLLSPGNIGIPFILRVQPGAAGTDPVASVSALPAYTTILQKIGNFPPDLAQYVSNWLAENVLSGAVVDNTFTIDGAAAPAKLTGVRLKALEEATIETDDTLSVSGAAADAKATGDALKELGWGELFVYEFETSPGYRGNNGAVNAQSASKEVYTDLLPVTPGETVTCTVETNASHSLFCRCNQYSETRTHIRAADTSVSGTKQDYTVTVPEGTHFLSFSYRTYDDLANVAITKPIPPTDTSLTKPNVPADAAVVGAKFRKIQLPVKGFTMADASDNYLKPYQDSTTRCSNYASPLHVQAGDKISLADKSLYQLYIRCFVDGTMTYKAPSWVAEDFYAPYECDVVITFRANPEGNFYDAWKVASEQVSVEAETNEHPMLIGTIGAETPQNLIVTRELQTGYLVSGSGGTVDMANAVDGACEKTTGFIPAAKGDAFTMVQTYPLGFTSQPIATCVFYDADKLPLGSRIGGNLRLIDGDDGRPMCRATFSASADGTAYARFTFRSWDCAEVLLYRGTGVCGYSLSEADKRAATQVQTLPSAVSIKYPFKSINHRGYRGGGAPENTLPAYKASKKVGFDFVECDVYETADNELVIWHDETININGTSKNVTACTLAEIQSVTVGTGTFAGTPIPTFEEFAALCRAIDLYPYIELKTVSESGIQRMVDICKKNGIIHKCTWISFSVLRLSYVAKAWPMARLGMIGSVSNAKALKNGINEVFVNVNVYTQAKADECLAAGVGYEVYGVDTVSAICALPTYCTGVSTDNTVAAKALYDAAMES